VEQTSLENDRPRLPPERSSFPWLEIALAVLLTAGTIYAFYYFRESRESAAARPQPSAPAPDSTAGAAPPLRNPLPVPYGDANLPTLANSDSMMRESLVGLLGPKAFDELVVANRIIPRIVATIDNLPRKTAPRHLMPLNPAPGRFMAARQSGTIDPANYRRYAAYLHAMDAVPARSLVWVYFQTYPLFQRAYEELGYSGEYFNDRLVDAIDDLLATPEVREARLVQPKVFYEFADPDLESRSAGQKMLLRMGPENARRVKAKLGEIRAALAQPAGPPPESAK